MGGPLYIIMFVRQFVRQEELGLWSQTEQLSFAKGLTPRLSGLEGGNTLIGEQYGVVSYILLNVAAERGVLAQNRVLHYYYHTRPHLESAPLYMEKLLYLQ